MTSIRRTQRLLRPAENVEPVVAATAIMLRSDRLGSATWKSRRLARGVEPDGCYYVANADHVIGKRHIDLESDPPPDIVVEIDITNESLAERTVVARSAARHF